MNEIQKEIEKQLKDLLEKAEKIANTPVRLDTLERIARISSMLK